jgi:DsbC/DsbD-like thiol-disulfide interchange protein
MVRLIILCLFASVKLTCFAQSEQKVKWQYHIVSKGNNIFEVRLTATIDKGWHLYSHQQSSDAIALPTTIQFSKNPIVELKGEMKEEGTLIDNIDPATRTKSRYYSGQVVFVQKILRKKNILTVVNGDIEFMVCDDRQCLPPSTVKFQVKIP